MNQLEAMHPMKYAALVAILACIGTSGVIAWFMALDHANRQTYLDKYVVAAQQIAPGPADPDTWNDQVEAGVELYRLAQSLDTEPLPPHLEAEIQFELARHLVDSGFREESLAMLYRSRELGALALPLKHPVRQRTEQLLLELDHNDEELMPWDMAATDDVAPFTIFRRTRDWLTRSHRSGHKDHPDIDEFIARHKLVQRVRQTMLEPGDPLLARSAVENVYIQRCKTGSRDRSARQRFVTMLRDLDSQKPEELDPDAAIDHAAVLLELMRIDPDQQHAIDSGWAAVELMHEAYGDSYVTMAALAVFEREWAGRTFDDLSPSTIKSMIERQLALWKQLSQSLSIDPDDLGVFRPTSERALARNYCLNQRMDIKRNHETGKMSIADALERLDLIEDMLISMDEDPETFEESRDKMNRLRGDMLIREGRYAEAVNYLEPLPSKASVLAAHLSAQTFYTQSLMDLYQAWDEAEPEAGHRGARRQWTMAYRDITDSLASRWTRQIEEHGTEVKDSKRSQQRWQKKADEVQAELDALDQDD
jgi:hypothetical protein